jgi:hypothetical protein
MFRTTISRVGAIRALVLAGLFVIALIASTTVPAFASSNTWSSIGSMTTSRTGHTANAARKR